MSNLNKRIGKIFITDEIIDSNPKAVQKVLSKMIIIRCEHLFHKHSFEYIAISDRFEEVQAGCEAPTYEVVIKNGFISFKKSQW